MTNLLSTLHLSAKTAVPAGAGILISVPGAGGRTFDELTPSALAGLGFNLRGAWAASTAYAANDVVSYQGSSYAALAAFTSTSSFNGSNWLQLASKGDAGSGSSTISGITIDGSTILASTGSPYQMQTADRVVDVNKTTGAATKILLPINPTLWVEYIVFDRKGDASTNNITLALSGGGTINGAPTFLMNASYDAMTLLAVNATTWVIT